MTFWVISGTLTHRNPLLFAFPRRVKLANFAIQSESEYRKSLRRDISTELKASSDRSLKQLFYVF